MSSMNMVERAEVELVDDNSTFFAPVSSDLISMLMAQYRAELEKVERVSQLMSSPEYSTTVGYFLEGNRETDRGRVQVSDLFDLAGAKFSLNSHYWSRALKLTDVYDFMPQARRDIWNAMLAGERCAPRQSSWDKFEPLDPLPDFQEETVRSTLTELMAKRAEFMAEKVDGIFRGLSGDHVTNQPQGFSARMIIGYMLEYGSIKQAKSGLIHDLRGVIAKLGGRDEPKTNSSHTLISALEDKTGQWVTVDGGSLRIRLYKKGTAHLEVHPDIAWQLNRILAAMHPLAIPAEFRERPKKRVKEFSLQGRPLPFATLEILAIGLHRGRKGATDFNFGPGARENKLVFKDACAVLEALGGTPLPAGGFEFGYEIAPVIHQVVLSGCLPDQKSHQFYPTSENMATTAVDMAEIQDTDEVVEPSAGQGAIAEYLPKDRTVCVEISPLHCAVLKAKGFKTVQADFLKWAESAPKIDVCVMNPPFADGRAQLHAIAASTMLKPGGRLVAILPAPLRGKDFLGKGWTVTWSRIYEGEFAGTGVRVAIMKAVKDV